jgi:hypothetical protein
MKPDFSNILLIAGNGQNSGKTTFVCSVIRRFAKTQPVTAVKISPHFHKLSGRDHILDKTEAFTIVEEFSTDRNKDSSLMLQAGAKRVFFLLADDTHLLDAFLKVLEITGTDQPVVCESGGLINVLNPGVFLFVYQVGQETTTTRKTRQADIADRVIRNDGKSFSFNSNNLVFQNNGWEIIE